jgi:hypothetical protein
MIDHRHAYGIDEGLRINWKFFCDFGGGLWVLLLYPYEHEQ